MLSLGNVEAHGRTEPLVTAVKSFVVGTTEVPKILHFFCSFFHKVLFYNKRGARYLTGENLEVVCAEFFKFKLGSLTQ